MSVVRLAVEGPVAALTLDAPQKRNALGVSDLSDFAQALAEAHAAPDVRVLTVTGAGDRAFCAGVDFSDVGGRDWSDNPLTALCDGLEQFPLPTVAALNGAVWGGGVEIALACDFRIGVAGMRACAPPAKLGIEYEPDGIARAMRRLGAQAARRVFLAAETLHDAELLRIGFVDSLVAPEALAAAVADKAAALAALAPLAVRGMKRSILEIAEGRLDRPAARARIAAAWASEDLAEGLAAAKARRAPVFHGR